MCGRMADIQSPNGLAYYIGRP